MGYAIHKPTRELNTSADTPSFAGNPDYIVYSGAEDADKAKLSQLQTLLKTVPVHHLNFAADKTPSEMSAGEKAVVDADMAPAVEPKRPTAEIDKLKTAGDDLAMVVDYLEKRRVL